MICDGHAIWFGEVWTRGGRRAVASFICPCAWALYQCRGHLSSGGWEFWAEATQASSEMRSLCERRGQGRHVTRSSCRPAAILPFSLRTVQRTNCRFNFASQLVFKENFDDEPHSPMVVSLLQVGPSRACPRTHVPHLRSRSATCSRPFAVQFMDCWT